MEDRSQAHDLAAPEEQVGRHGQIAFRCQPVGLVTQIVTHPQDIGDDHHARPPARAVWHGEVRRHVTRDRDLHPRPRPHLRALGTMLRGEFSHQPRIKPAAAARPQRRIQARRLPGDGRPPQTAASLTPGSSPYATRLARHRARKAAGRSFRGYQADKRREQGLPRPVQVRAGRLRPLRDGELVAQDQNSGGLP